jgi:hypothetical protein
MRSDYSIRFGRVKVLPYYPFKGGQMMNDLKSENVLNFVGFAATGIAAYAAFDDKFKIAGVAAGAGILCFYGAIKALNERLRKAEAREERSEVWRETDNIHVRISELEDKIANCVSKNTFDDVVKDIHHKIDSTRDDNGRDMDAVYRYISDETSQIHTRIDNCSSECMTACSGKRK